ncbi:MAG: FGGY-family carbohydrate kinase [Ornithinimicrobium sp.]
MSRALGVDDDPSMSRRPELILAIDGGSQSTKVTIFDAVGSIRAQGRAPLRPYLLTSDGRAVHPDDDLWDSLCAATRAAMSDLHQQGIADPTDIIAIGLCSIRYCRALMDASGRLVEPVLSWMDTRVSEPARDLDASVSTIASAAGYLTVRLTGQRRDSAAAYKGMWPINDAGMAWSGDPADFDRTGMPAMLLPELVAPGSQLGEVTAVAAHATRLPVGCPVFATANDKAVEALGVGLSAAFDRSAGAGQQTVLLSLGTYIASMTADRASTVHPASGGPHTWVNSSAVPGEVLLESKGIRRGMWTVSWLRNLLTSAPGTKDLPGTQAWLEQGAREIPPGSEGLFVVPDFLAGPDGPERRGSILGLAGQHGPHHLHRAVLEGIVLTMRGHTRALIEALDLQSAHVVVAGGGAQSDLMMQLVADSWGMTAIRAGMPDAAGLGSAVCACVGVGVHPDFPAAIAAMVRLGRAFTPDAIATGRYAQVAEVFGSLTDFTDPMYRYIHAAQP